MNKWRIYRLPGSRENWHIDSGAGTGVVNVKQWQCFEDTQSIDVGGSSVPRAWIEVSETELHVIDGLAMFCSSEVLSDLLKEIRISILAATGKLE